MVCLKLQPSYSQYNQIFNLDTKNSYRSTLQPKTKDIKPSSQHLELLGELLTMYLIVYTTNLFSSFAKLRHKKCYLKTTPSKKYIFLGNTTYIGVRIRKETKLDMNQLEPLRFNTYITRIQHND